MKKKKKNLSPLGKIQNLLGSIAGLGLSVIGFGLVAYFFGLAYHVDTGLNILLGIWYIPYAILLVIVVPILMFFVLQCNIGVQPKWFFLRAAKQTI